MDLTKFTADQLHKIYLLCGSADEDNWPGVSKLPKYDDYKPQSPMERCIKEVFKDVDTPTLELLDKMLTLDLSILKAFNYKEEPDLDAALKRPVFEIHMQCVSKIYHHHQKKQ
ncbi:cyclin-dependent kinase C-2-like isoform X1 [Magnolia sinica]|uniref:cyclin-dependent kinase C-2-like isoform X1 n=1 Tax=Magnolia sinica TaxID=86752 RepID=UPI00265B0A12|nr:cyclin-dependent kinase C-2-like isoform X1 [Magnolia sinica]